MKYEKPKILAGSIEQMDGCRPNSSMGEKHCITSNMGFGSSCVRREGRCEHVF